jgi:hypothetical protein
MSKKEDFVCLVQTAAIVESLSRGEKGNECKASEIAAIAVSCAMKVDENELPEDLSEACAKHIEYVFDNSIPKPRWLIGIL